MSEPTVFPPTQVEPPSGRPDKTAMDLEVSLTGLPSDCSVPPLPPSLKAVAAPKPEPDPTSPPEEITTPRRGQFTILKRHASGGVGHVHLARDEKLHRQVALKEIRAERRNSRTTRQRFLNEAEITGQLEHPGIVPIYALDHDEAGNPYYAMRFIQGQTLGQAIREYHQSPSTLRFRALLQHFVAVCQTMAYAHSKGVMHRDLKPANIMLGEFGETLILDWGLAKRIGSEEVGSPAGEVAQEGVTDKQSLSSSPHHLTTSPEVPVGDRSKEERSSSELTEAGQVVGTLAYMSPEQAEGKLAELGPATDIFALGAILYELLTGRYPYHEASQSTLLFHARLGRFPPPRQVKKNVPRPLEAICLKATAVLPEQRYASVAELAREVERWLADEPVAVFPEPWTLRLNRWVRRRKAWVIGAAALLVSAVVTLAVGNVFLRQANEETRRERNAALTAKEEAETARHRAETAEQQAKQAAAEATAVTNFLVKDMIELAQPLEGCRLLTVKQAMDAAAPRIAEVFGRQPPLEAAVREAIGRSYFSLGFLNEAHEHLARAVELRQQTRGPEHEVTLQVEQALCHCLHQLGRYAEVEQRLRRMLAVNTQRHGERAPATLLNLNYLGMCLMDQRRLDEAEPLLRRSYDALLDLEQQGQPVIHARLAAAGHWLILLLGRGRWEEAETQGRQVLADYRQIYGDNNAATWQTKMNFSSALINRGKMAEAEKLLREILPSYRRIYGEDHFQTVMLRINLSAALIGLGRWVDADSVTRETLDSCRRTLPRDNRNYQRAVVNRIAVLTRLGRLAEAAQVFRESPGYGKSPGKQ